MGFSLKMFIEELENVIKDPSICDVDKAWVLATVIRENKQYAKECGMLE